MIPDRLGRYEIRGVLGAGGMAIVYLGFDPLIQREIAVKVLLQQLTFDEQFIARFKREAMVIAALEHPAIVPIYDFGEYEGQPFLVMRHMPGGTLQNWIEDEPISLEESSHVFNRICQALDVAHQRGIIHRDLKPANILFDRIDDKRNAAYLSDFGIAKIMEDSGVLTGQAVIGTPEYMSPEQAYGDKEVDARTDIYALGAILFKMLTGKPPFEADTPMRLIMAHINESPPDIRELNPDLPEGVEEIIVRAMAKAQEDRYTRASEMAEDLAALLAPEIHHDEPEIEPPEEQAAIPATVIEEPDGRTPEIAGDLPPAHVMTEVEVLPVREESDPTEPEEPELSEPEVLAVVPEVVEPTERFEFSPEAARPRAGLSALTGRLAKFPVWIWGVGAVVLLCLATSPFLARGLIPAAPSDTPTAWPTLTNFPTTVVPSPTLSPTRTSVPPTRTPAPTRTPTMVPVVPTEPSFAIVAVQYANVREGPGTVYLPIDTFTEGTEFTIVGRNEEGTWLVIALDDGQQGWIALSVLETDVDLDMLEIVEAPPPPYVAPVPTRKAGGGGSSNPTPTPNPFEG